MYTVYVKQHPGVMWTHNPCNTMKNNSINWIWNWTHVTDSDTQKAGTPPSRYSKRLKDAFSISEYYSVQWCNNQWRKRASSHSRHDFEICKEEWKKKQRTPSKKIVDVLVEIRAQHLSNTSKKWMKMSQRSQFVHTVVCRAVVRQRPRDGPKYQGRFCATALQTRSRC
jgi:hypothetical protein